VSVPESFFVLAYGPFPGIELIPYFLALVVWAGMALFAALLAPLRALWRRLRERRSTTLSSKAASASPAELGSDRGND
jgi:hypothetical protein